MPASCDTAGVCDRPSAPSPRRRASERTPLTLRPPELVPLTGPAHTSAVRALAGLLLTELDELATVAGEDAPVSAPDETLPPARRQRRAA